MTRVVYLNGEFLHADAARISVFDGGFLHGAGLFETLRAESGRVFRIETHLDRLSRSAETLSLPIPRAALPHAEVFEELLVRNQLQQARLRLTATPGPILLPAGRDAQPQGSFPPTSLAPTLCVTADDLHAHPPEAYANGVSVLISRRPQHSADPLTAHKTLCYLPRLAALQQARLARCAEALFFDETNHLAEGAISNVFVARKGRLRSPSLSTPVLPGVARRVVFELAAELNLDVDDAEPITIDDLLDADEVFLTNVIVQVLPVTRVERRTIADGKPGPLTRKLLDAFKARVAAECAR